MANKEHVLLLKNSPIEVFNRKHKDELDNCLDLSNEDFQGFDFRKRYLKNVNFENANLAGANFTKINFENANLKNVNFTRANLRRTKFINVQSIENANFTSTDLSKSHLDYVSFANICLSNANLSQSNLKGTSFDGAQLCKANFYESIIDQTSFKNAKGLAKAKNLETTKIRELPKHFDGCERALSEQYLDWERLSVLGRLPLFGASYIALIFIPLIYYGIAIYNKYIEIIKNWTQNEIFENFRLYHEIVIPIRNNLQSIEFSTKSLTMLISTILLAIASTIYVFFCPSRIKEYSKDKWVDQLNKSLMHYWAFSWKHRIMRLLCFFCYLAGGLGVLALMIKKITGVFLIILKYSS